MPVHPVLSLDRQGIIEAMENKEVSTWCLFEMVSGRAGPVGITRHISDH